METKQDLISDETMLTALVTTYHLLKSAKPEERSERARRYAVAITEYEKMLAYFKAMVVEELQ